MEETERVVAVRGAVVVGKVSGVVVMTGRGEVGRVLVAEEKVSAQAAKAQVVEGKVQEGGAGRMAGSRSRAGSSRRWQRCKSGRPLALLTTRRGKYSARNNGQCKHHRSNVRLCRWLGLYFRRVR